MSDLVKIGEVAKQTGLSKRTLQYYDEIGLLAPSSGGKGIQRLYSREDLSRLQRIRSLQQIGFSLEEIKKCLDLPDFEPLKVVELHLAHVEEKLATTQSVQRRLLSLSQSLRTTEEPTSADLLLLLHDMNLLDQHYSPDQQEYLEKRRHEVGEEKIEQAKADWKDLFEQFKVELESGSDPANERVLVLAKKAQDLIEGFTGGNEGIRTSLGNMYKANPNLIERWGVERDVWDYMGKATQALRRENEAQITTVGEWKVSYETQGIGDPAIVLVHGWSSNRHYWKKVRDLLSTRHRVLTLDLLGHGESDKPETDYSMSLFSRCVEAAMNGANVQTAILVGHSNGVPVIREFYRNSPLRVQRLIFLDGSLEPIPKLQAEWMQNTMSQPNYPDIMKRMVEQLPRGRLTQEEHAQIKADQLATPKHVMAGGLAAMTDPHVFREDPISVPVHFIAVGKCLGPSANPQPILEKIAPQSTFETWDDVSHFMILEAPERVAKLILSPQAP